MKKKFKKDQSKNRSDNSSSSNQFSPQVENKYKNILRIISWVMSICFISIIILPNFNFYLVDEIVKFLFFFGLANLLLFTFIEIFNKSAKKILTSIEIKK